MPALEHLMRNSWESNTYWTSFYVSMLCGTELGSVNTSLTFSLRIRFSYQQRSTSPAYTTQIVRSFHDAIEEVFWDVTPYSLPHRHVSGEPAASICRKEEWKKIFELWSKYSIVTRRIECKYNNRQLTTHLSQMFNVTVQHLSASQDHIRYPHLYKDSGKLFYILCHNNYINFEFPCIISLYYNV
jgi:hypothetical protein